MSYRNEFRRENGQSDPLKIEDEGVMKPLEDADDLDTLKDIREAVGKVEEDKDYVEYVKTGYWIYKVDYNERLGKPQVLCFSYRGGYTFNPVENSSVI